MSSAGGCPVPRVGTGFVSQFVDRVDRSLHLLVAEHHRAQHDVFGQFHGFGLDHQHGGFGAGDDQIQRRVLQFGVGRVEHVFAVDEADAGGAHRAVERQAGQRQRGGGADQGGNVGVDFGIGGHHRGDDLHFVEEAFRKQRADRAVDQAGNQDFAFGRTAFALEKATGDAAGGVGFFLIVDGQREKVLAGLDFVLGNDGDQHHGVVHVDHDGAGCLAGDFAGFQRDLMAAVGESLLDSAHTSSFQSKNAPHGRGVGNSGGNTPHPLCRCSRVPGHHRWSCEFTCAGRDARSGSCSLRDWCA